MPGVKQDPVTDLGFRPNLDPIDIRKGYGISVRHHRALVGLKHVKEIVIWFGNRFKIMLSNDMDVISSREKSKILKQVLKF